MGSKLSTKRKRRQQSRNVTTECQRSNDFSEQRRTMAHNVEESDSLTDEEEISYDLEELRDRFISAKECSDSEESSSWTSEEEKCYDPLDSTLTFVEGDDDLDFLCNDYKSLRAKMSCGHAVTPMSLTDWCRWLLDEGECKFVCGQTDCDAEWPFDEVCKMALLTPEETEYFEKKLFSNAAKDYLDVKVCPGCKSCIMRADLSDLSVICTVCTADRKKTYRFCWQCLRKWKGPAPRSDRCENDGCQNPVEILKTCPDVIFEDVRGVTGCPSIRACPTCGLLVEHNKTQCKNIVCRRCKVEFCFVCLKLTDACEESDIVSSFYELCSSGVAPRQTSVPVWQRT